MKKEKLKKYFNTSTQIIIPIFTVLAQVAVAAKNPQLGLLLNLIVQPFWIYSGWIAYKKAGQIGLFITAVILTFVLTIGVINYQIN